jgi:hypothetical protein
MDTKKGLSTKISTIIIAAIVITVALAITLYIQTSTNPTTTTQQTSKTTTTASSTTTQITTNTDTLKIKLNKTEYEIAKEETDPNIWKITLECTNTGTEDITIEEILVNNNSIKSYPIDDQIELPTTIAKDSTTTIVFKIPASKDYKPNQTVEVKLKTTTNIEYTLQILLKY